MSKVLFKCIACAMVVILVFALTGCSSSETVRKEKHIIEYMEKKYGIPFEILSIRSDGRAGNSSFNVGSPKYPGTWCSVDIYDEFTPKERIYDGYAFIKLQDEWCDHYMTRIHDFFGEESFLYEGRFMISEEGNKQLENSSQIDLEKVNFKALGETGKGMYKGADILIYYIKDLPDGNCDSIYKELYNWVKYQKDLGMTITDVQIMVFDEVALKDPEIVKMVKKVRSSSGLGSGELFNKLCTTNFFAYGSVREKLDVTKIKTLEDLKLVFKIKKAKR